MSSTLPEAYWGEWHDKQGFVCGRCGRGMVAPEIGDSLAEIVKLIRAHQRSEACA